MFPFNELKTNSYVTSICDLLDFNNLVVGDIQGELSIWNYHSGI